MANIFRRSYTLPIPPDAELLTVKGVPSAKFKKNGKKKIAPLTKDGKRVCVQSPCWYGWIDGRSVKLFTDAVSSQQRLAELIRKSERQESGILDPFEAHRKRPIGEHLADWGTDLRNKGCKESHIRATSACVTRIIAACRFEVAGDIDGFRLEQFLADLCKNGPAPRTLDPNKDVFTKAEVAAALGINRTAVASLIRRHRLAASGQGKARRYPKATIEALLEKRGRGASAKTRNLYLSGMKAFCNFLVEKKRIAVNPITGIKAIVVHESRRDRRILDETELGAVITAAEGSEVVFRQLTGIDRAMLYRLACASGFRAHELAVLCPKDFDLDRSVAILSGLYTKNKKKAEQPLPPDVVESLRGHLVGKPVGRPIWPGTWFKRAAEMLRIELDAVGIPYVIDGADGPLYADFHALRHSYIAMLDRNGATLKEAMQLARHSDPKLTMKVYGKLRPHDLASTIDRLPPLGREG